MKDHSTHPRTDAIPPSSSAEAIAEIRKRLQAFRKGGWTSTDPADPSWEGFVPVAKQLYSHAADDIDTLLATYDAQGRGLEHIRKIACVSQPYSSRMCEFGSKGCDVRHKEQAQRLAEVEAHIVSLCNARDDAEGRFIHARATLAEAEAINTKLIDALVGLVGASTREELEQLEAAMRLMPAPAEDKAVSINAIHALLAAQGHAERQAP